MIASLNGKVILKKEKFLIVENNGIGYKVYISVNSFIQINTTNNIFIWIYTHLRENCLELYGFLDYEELEFFEMLLTISGIGPKSALSILGLAPINNFKKAISEEDLSYLTKISGIGKKTAEKIILELKDKIIVDKTTQSLKADIDTMEVLKSMGYSVEDIREALKKTDAGLSVNDKIRNTLKILSNK